MALRLTPPEVEAAMHPARPALFGRRPNPVFSDAYRPLREAAIEARRSCGVTQRELARRMGKCASHITMIERGQRRIDTLELFRMAVVLGLDPVDFFASVAARLAAHDGEALERKDV